MNKIIPTITVEEIPVEWDLSAYLPVGQYIPLFIQERSTTNVYVPSAYIYHLSGNKVVYWTSSGYETIQLKHISGIGYDERWANVIPFIIKDRQNYKNRYETMYKEVYVPLTEPEIPPHLNKKEE